MALFKRRTDLQKLLREMDATPIGPERVAIAERGIIAAYAQGDEDAGFAFREGLLLSCGLLGRLARAIPAMEWCLERCDADPERFDPKRVLFQYRWIIEELVEHTSYDAGTIERGMADLERRFLAAGWSRRGVLELRMSAAWKMHRPEDAEAFFPEWDSLPPDDGSDCAACATALRVRYLMSKGRGDAAIEAAAPLMAGAEVCVEEPARCFSRLQFALAELGRVEEAVEVHTRSVEATADGLQYADVRANHMMFQLMGGLFEAAGEFLEFSLPQAIESERDLAVLQTCDAGWIVLSVLRARGLAMPSLRPVPELGIESVEDWAAWMGEQRVALGEAFDRRNGNDAWLQQRARGANIVERLGSVRGED